MFTAVIYAAITRQRMADGPDEPNVARITTQFHWTFVQSPIGDQSRFGRTLDARSSEGLMPSAEIELSRVAL